MSVEIPVEITDITPAWLSAALQEGGMRGVEVENVTSQRIAEGVGFIGQIHRLSIDYADTGDGAPATVIAKMPTGDPGGRMVGAMMRLYEKESGFYRHLADECPAGTATCYYNGADIDAGNYCLLLEDLSGFEPGDQLTPRNLDQAQEMLAQLARIHGSWAGDRGAAHSWLPSIDDASSLVMLGMFDDAYPVTMERYAHVIPSYMHDWGPKFAKVAPQWLADFAGQPSTIVHGDYRTDNFMFGDNGTSRLLDWQVMSRSPGAYDVYYFLGLSCDPQMVADNLDPLLELYREEHAATGTPAPDVETLLQQMRGVGLWLTTLGTVSFSQLDPANERGEALFLSMWERGISLAERIDLSPLVP